jgi:hypothetical protein
MFGDGNIVNTMNYFNGKNNQKLIIGGLIILVI